MVTNQEPRREKFIQNMCCGMLFAAVQIGIFGPPVVRAAMLAIDASRAVVTHTAVAVLSATAH